MYDLIQDKVLHAAASSEYKEAGCVYRKSRLSGLGQLLSSGQ